MSYSASVPIPKNMQNTIRLCTGGLGAVGVVGEAPGPGADLIVIAPTWAGVVVTLACQAGYSMNEQTAKKLCIAVAAGAGSSFLGTKVASTVFGWLLAIPSAGLSLAASMTANAGINAKFTNSFGKAVARYFLQTDEVAPTDVAAQILVALVGIELGVPSGHSDVVA